MARINSRVRLWDTDTIKKATSGKEPLLLTELANAATYSVEMSMHMSMVKPHALKEYLACWNSDKDNDDFDPREFLATDDETAKEFILTVYTALPDELYLKVVTTEQVF